MPLIREILICSMCKESLDSFSPGELQCPQCSAKYDIREGKFHAFDRASFRDHDPTDRLKSRIKRFSRLYYFMVNVVSPVPPTVWFMARRRIKEMNKLNGVAANIGSGNSRLDSAIINVDFQPYSNVDIVADINDLPIESNSLDLIINIAVLEHVKDPASAVMELQRILKVGGEIFAFVPFIQGYHASPDDYTRFTSSGIRDLFADFDIIKITSVGPTGGMLWIFQEWAALVLCFGSKRIQRFLTLTLMILTFPLKFIDVILRHYEPAENIASGFLIQVKKKHDT